MQTFENNHKLYLIPTPISKNKSNLVLPDHTVQIIKKLNCFIVEKVQTAQSFLQWIKHPDPIHEITFRVINRKTPAHETISFLNLLNNQSVGLMSEAGAPGVADPGADFIKLVHEKNYQVVPLVGPSSILLALMASGLNGQQFSFHGYLPIDSSKRTQSIQDLEINSLKSGFTHIFMETPHRNTLLFENLLNTLRSSTKLCIATSLTSGEEYVATKLVRDWKNMQQPDLQRKPTLFLINAK